jgi:DNA polymerase (family 10)
MSNDEVARVFYEMADLLKVRGGDPHRARAFERTGRILESLREPASELLKFGRLRSITGIGEGSVERIKAILHTGTCLDHKRLLEKLPVGLRDLLQVRGLGPALVRQVHAHLGVSDLDQLEWAARNGQLARVPGISQRLQLQLIDEIHRVRRGKVRVPLARALEEGGAILEVLRAQPGVLRAEQTGSARRRRETVKDLDFLVVATESGPVSEAFRQLAGDDARVLLAGSERSTVLLPSGLQADMRIVPFDNFGAGMHYFTGSKAHNIRVRLMANQRGLAISEHGVFAKAPGKQKRGRSSRIEGVRYSAASKEEDIFAAVGLPFIPPELREDEGEIEAAERGKLPALVEERALRGELCAHTDRGDGRAPLRNLMAAVKARGLSYVAVTESARAFKTAKATRVFLEEVRAARGGVEVLAGLSVDVRADGRLPLSHKLLSEADWVVARLGEGATTEAAVAAAESGVVDVVDGARELDVERVARACAHRGVALALRAHPDGPGLAARQCRLCKEVGARIVVTSDARAPEELDWLRYGIMTARRGWLEAADVLNAAGLDEVRAFRAARLGAKAPSGPPDQAVDALAAQLGAGLVDEELRARLERYLKEGDDPPLQRALERVAGPGMNALQVAFTALVGGP